MRLPIYVLIAAIGVTLATGCSGKNNDNQNASSTSADTTVTATASAPADASATAAATAGDVPTYPGATVQAAGTSSSAGGVGTTTGKVMSTTDSFDDVYKWYQKNLPAGSEKAHVTSPMETAAFQVGDGKNQTNITISTVSGKTIISIAKLTQ
jgi:hypothetical protein